MVCAAMGLWGLHNPVAGVPLSNYQITMVHGPNGYRCGCHWVCGYGQWGCITQFLWGVSAHMEWSVGPNGYRVVPNWGAAMVVWGLHNAVFGVPLQSGNG